jgi:hypothetical protein
VAHPFLPDLVTALAKHDFRPVPSTSNTLSDVTVLLKRQTWNSNRAIVVVAPSQIPVDLSTYLRSVGKSVAFGCGFIPFFWGIGIQVIVVAPGIAHGDLDPGKYVSRFDNQWAIVQSVFLVDADRQSFRAARSWGQIFTGKIQDAITDILARHFTVSKGSTNHGK